MSLLGQRICAMRNDSSTPDFIMAIQHVLRAHLLPGDNSITCSGPLLRRVEVLMQTDRYFWRCVHTLSPAPFQA